MKELLLSFLFALVVGSMINGCSQSTPLTDTSQGESESGAGSTGSTTGSASQTGSSQIQETSEKKFDADVLKSDSPVLVEFGAKWCQPCKKMAPILEEVATEYSGKLKVMRVDVDENRNLSDQYAQAGLPTFILFKGGQARQMQSGEMPKPVLVDKFIKPYV